MATIERVTVTLSAELIENIDRLEKNRSRFITKAVEHELHFNVEAGAQLPGNLIIKVAFDGLLGQEGSLDRFGTRTELPRRRLFSAWTGLIWKASERLTLEAAGRYRVAGEDFPAGLQFFVNAAYQFQLFRAQGG